MLTTIAELASTFSGICGRGGAMNVAGLSHLNGVSKLKDSLVNFMTQKIKQGKLTDSFRAK